MAGSTKGRSARPGEDEAEHHRRDKGSRHAPQRPAADLGRPKADSDHRKDVVGSEQRMGKARHQRPVFGWIEMGEGRCGGAGEERGCEKDGFLHSGPPYRH